MVYTIINPSQFTTFSSDFTLQAGLDQVYELAQTTKCVSISCLNKIR